MILLDAGRIRFDGALDTLRSTLDRPCLEMTFGTAQSAAWAASTIHTGHPDATTDLIDATTLRVVLDAGTHVGRVLDQIQPVLTDLHGMKEVTRPLRDLLADVYLRGDVLGGSTPMPPVSPSGVSK